MDKLRQPERKTPPRCKLGRKDARLVDRRQPVKGPDHADAAALDGAAFECHTRRGECAPRLGRYRVGLARRRRAEMKTRPTAAPPCCPPLQSFLVERQIFLPI